MNFKRLLWISSFGTAFLISSITLAFRYTVDRDFKENGQKIKAFVVNTRQLSNEKTEYEVSFLQMDSSYSNYIEILTNYEIGDTIEVYWLGSRSPELKISSAIDKPRYIIGHVCLTTGLLAMMCLGIFNPRIIKKFKTDTLFTNE